MFSMRAFYSVTSQRSFTVNPAELHADYLYLCLIVDLILTQQCSGFFSLMKQLAV